MKQSQSRYEIRQQASLSQKLAHRQPEFSDYAGSDPKLSDSIAVLNFCAVFGLVNPKDEGFKMAKGLLNELRKARFATSEKVNEISKLGFQMPKGTSEVDYNDEAE